MTTGDLFPPITAATILMIIWVAVAHRLGTRDAAEGREGFFQLAWLSIVPIGLLAYLYVFGLGQPVTSAWQVIVATALAEGLAILVIFALQKLLFQRHRNWRETLYWVGGAGMMIFVVIAGVLHS